MPIARSFNWSKLHTAKKRLIIGDYLFGEIGEFFKFAKISCHQIETLQSLDITSVGNRQINSLPNCHIWKTAKYNSRQIFSFYSNGNWETTFYYSAIYKLGIHFSSGFMKQINLSIFFTHHVMGQHLPLVDSKYLDYCDKTRTCWDAWIAFSVNQIRTLGWNVSVMTDEGTSRARIITDFCNWWIIPYMYQLIYMYINWHRYINIHMHMYIHWYIGIEHEYAPIVWWKLILYIFNNSQNMIIMTITWLSKHFMTK